mgnify:CR=1 FL=1
MVDLSEKSKEEIFREKKEAELREAKRREGEWKRRKDKERKCMIGGTFLKHFPDALLFEADEWDMIVQSVIDTDAFRNTIEAIRKEAAVKQKSQEQKKKSDRDTQTVPTMRKTIGGTTYIVTAHFSETSKETMSDKICRMIKRDIESGNY